MHFKQIEIDEIIMSYLNVYDFKAYIPASAKEQTHILKLLGRNR